MCCVCHRGQFTRVWASYGVGPCLTPPQLVPFFFSLELTLRHTWKVNGVELGPPAPPSMFLGMY